MHDSTTALIIACIGALGGLVPPFAAFFIQRLGRRSVLSKQRQTIDFAHRQAEFLNVWLKAQKLVCSSEEFSAVSRLVVDELNELRLQVSIRARATDEVMSKTLYDLREGAPKKRNWTRRMLLFYFPRSAGAWVFHLLFYMGFGFSSFLALGFIYLWIASGEGPEFFDALVLLLIVCGFLAVTYLFSWVPARFIDKRHKRLRSERIKP